MLSSPLAILTVPLPMNLSAHLLNCHGSVALPVLSPNLFIHASSPSSRESVARIRPPPGTLSVLSHSVVRLRFGRQDEYVYPRSVSDHGPIFPPPSRVPDFLPLMSTGMARCSSASCSTLCFTESCSPRRTCTSTCTKSECLCLSLVVGKDVA